MRTDKVLLVWYSRTGTTRAVAHAIARDLACDVEELIDTRGRGGIMGAARAAVDALLGRLTIVRTVTHDPAAYDLVIVGTPVWSGSVTPAVRTYLLAHRREFARIAFFCVSDSGLTRRVFEQMTALSGRAPDNILALHETDVRACAFMDRIHEFVSALTQARVAA
jgi:flavodoxin